MRPIFIRTNLTFYPEEKGNRWSPWLCDRHFIALNFPSTLNTLVTNLSSEWLPLANIFLWRSTAISLLASKKTFTDCCVWSLSMCSDNSIPSYRFERLGSSRWCYHLQPLRHDVRGIDCHVHVWLVSSNKTERSSVKEQQPKLETWVVKLIQCELNSSSSLWISWQCIIWQHDSEPNSILDHLTHFVRLPKSTFARTDWNLLFRPKKMAEHTLNKVSRLYSITQAVQTGTHTHICSTGPTACWTGPTATDLHNSSQAE